VLVSQQQAQVDSQRIEAQRQAALTSIMTSGDVAKADIAAAGAAHAQDVQLATYQTAANLNSQGLVSSLIRSGALNKGGEGGSNQLTALLASINPSQAGGGYAVSKAYAQQPSTAASIVKSIADAGSNFSKAFFG
jgi:hypothetical protein